MLTTVKLDVELQVCFLAEMVHHIGRRLTGNRQGTRQANESRTMIRIFGTDFIEVNI